MMNSNVMGLNFFEPVNGFKEYYKANNTGGNKNHC